jgi:hypothetical protein
VSRTGLWHKIKASPVVARAVGAPCAMCVRARWGLAIVAALLALTWAAGAFALS